MEILHKRSTVGLLRLGSLDNGKCFLIDNVTCIKNCTDHASVTSTNLLTGEFVVLPDMVLVEPVRGAKVVIE